MALQEQGYLTPVLLNGHKVTVLKHYFSCIVGQVHKAQRYWTLLQLGFHVFNQLAGSLLRRTDIDVLIVSYVVLLLHFLICTLGEGGSDL